MAASTVLSTINSIPGKKAGSKNTGKSADSKRPTQPPTKCPECASQRIWKDGLRYVKSETATIPLQRFICRDCGRRFSENNCAPPNPKMGSNPTRRADVNLFASYLQHIQTGYKTSSKLSSSTAGRDHRSGGREAASFPRIRLRKGVTGAEVERKVGPRRGQVCTLSQKTRMEKAAGATRLSKAEIQGKLIEYAWHLKKQGYPDSTIKMRSCILERMVRRGANLMDVENVKLFISMQKTWGEGFKMSAVYAYAPFVEMEGLTWKPPRYKKPDKKPFVPTESELDQLIFGCRKTVSIFLQTLKDTGADPGEALRIEWPDINKKAPTITLSYPVKGHDSRTVRVSRNLISRLELLPKRAERIFTATYRGMASNYWTQRKRVVREQNNPRLLRITFRSFRHWRATYEYHETRSLLHVKKLLGHKNVQNTMVYIDIERALYGDEEDANFISRGTTSTKGARTLIEAGFQYVCTTPNGTMLFRKRK